MRDGAGLIMPTQEEYKVKLEVFEGPLDLLLYLIKKEEVDIYNIPIEKITTQYREYLNLMRMLDLNIAGEFIVMAATLMMIKSRMLLPADERPEMEEEEEDPRWDLVRQLVEYKKFKDAALRLQEKELFQENVFALGSKGVIPETKDPGMVIGDISLFDLISAFNEALKRAKPEELGEIFAEKWTVADKIDVILGVIARNREVSFTALFGERAGRHEIICTFLAVLELIRLRQVNITQKERFGEIILSGAEHVADEPVREPEEAVPPLGSEGSDERGAHVE
jgi:segregation and condensation protein A